jgi:hypothetical protein
MHSSSSWRSSPTGRYIVVVGERYQDNPAVRYPQRKDDSFNVEKIVATVTERRAARKARAAAQATAAVKKQTAAELAADLNSINGTTIFTGSYEYSVQTSYNRHDRREVLAEPGHVFANVGRLQLNHAQAAVLVAALAEVKKLATKKS